MMQRLRHGEDNHLETIKKIVDTKSAYTIHYHHNFGLEVNDDESGISYSVKKDLCTYGKWYESEFHVS